MKKILFINGSATPLKCGVGFYGERLIAELSQTTDVNLLTTSPYGKSTIANGKLHHVTKWGIASLRAITKKVSKVAPNVIHIQYPAVGFGRQLGINLLPLYLRIFYRKAPVVLTLHEYHSSALLGRIRTVITALFVHKIIVSNPSDLQALPRLFKNRATIIPIGSNITLVPKNPKTLASIIKHYGLDQALPTVMYFGFTNRAKGVDVLAQAASDIRANVLLVTELSSEDAYQNQVLQTVERVKKSGGLLAVTGYLPDNEISELLQASDIFVLPQPLPITSKSGTTIAAAQHGLPIVSTASTNPQLNSPYINGKNAVLVDTMNPTNLANAVNDLLHDVKLQKTITSNLPALETYFSWQDIANKHSKLYETI